MPMVLVISSFVAASRVGGGIAPYVLGPMKIDPVHVPTTLLGRHPGWGPPGGGAVSPDMMRGMLEGIAANGIYGRIDAVVTGYFANADQVRVAAGAIDAIRAAPRERAHKTTRETPLVIVDPIMGDADTGRYVAEGVAEALMQDLIPRADLVAANLWEFGQICGRPDIATVEDIVDVARAQRRAWLVTSVDPGGGAAAWRRRRTGVLHVDAGAAHLADAQREDGEVPRGVGDLLKLRFAGGVVAGLGVRNALARAVGATSAVIARAIEWRSPELPLAACSDVLASPPKAHVRRLKV